MEQVTLKIDGMSCGHCVRAVEEALREVPGARVERVAIGEATVAVAEGAGGRAALEAAVREAGYEVRAV